MSIKKKNHSFIKVFLISILVLLSIFIFKYLVEKQQSLVLVHYINNNYGFSFQYPQTAKVYVPKRSSSSFTIVRVLSKYSTCDLYIDAPYKEPDPANHIQLGNMVWQKRTMNTFTPPLGNFYDMHSAIWWIKTNGHYYRWQSTTESVDVCEKIISTFKSL